MYVTGRVRDVQVLSLSGFFYYICNVGADRNPGNREVASVEGVNLPEGRRTHG